MVKAIGVKITYRGAETGTTNFNHQCCNDATLDSSSNTSSLANDGNMSTSPVYSGLVHL